MFSRVVEFIGAMFLSLLPPRYRDRFVQREGSGLQHAAWVSGVFECLLAIGFLIGQLFMFARAGPDPVASEMGKQWLNNSQMDLGQTMAGAGIVTLANFALQPANIIAYYFVIEGVVRILAGGITAQPLGTLPLYIVSGIHGWIEPLWRERRMGARIVDEIVPGDRKTYEMKTLSCRPKPDWHRNITIRYRDEFYQMFKEETGPKPRPFIYYLRKPPIGHLIVVIRDYSPQDVLKQKA